MNKFYHVFFIMVIILFLFVFHAAGADGGQPTHDGNIDLPESDIGLSFRPSIAIVIGILGFMFALTFLLIIYAKFCHVASSSVPFTFGNDFNEETDFHLHGFIPTRSSRFSGIDKTLIESLPFFKFSSLKGSKQGLECAVCLSKFEDSEILRLLPKCKHAFHINCVDQWLESHSSCPLCRRKVNIEDLAIFTLSTSSRSIFHNPSSLDLRDDSNFELFVEREEDDHGSSRFSIGSSFRKYEKGKKEDKELLLTDQDYGINDQNKEGLNENSIVVVDEGCDANKQLHKFKHKIIVSDIVNKNRWSDVNSSDLMLLNSEMLNFMSSKRFASGAQKTNSTNCDMSSSVQEISAEPTPLMKIREEMERKRLFENKIISIRNDNSEQVPNLPSTSTNPNFMSSSSSNNRSISEITVFSRSGDFGVKNKSKDERLKRVWYPIARRTVQWIVGRERRTSEQLPQQNSRLFSVV